MRIALYGATGAVGSTTLIHLLKGVDLHAGDELVLVGRGTAVSSAKLCAMKADLLDAFDAGIVKLAVCDSLDSLGHVDVFIMAAGATLSANLKSRSELAGKNVSLFHDAASRLSRQSPHALVLIVSNPVELAVAIFTRYLHRNHVLGMGAQQDSLRFARAIAAHLGVPRTAVRASVTGEHGEGMVPLWSSVYLVDEDGDAQGRLNELRAASASADTSTAAALDLRRQVERLLAQGEGGRAYGLLESVPPEVKIQLEPLVTVRVLHSTPNATANAILDCIAVIRNADGRRIHGQVLLEGEFYGMSGVLGVPLSLERSEWRIGLYEPLTDRELQRLRETSESIAHSYRSFLAPEGASLI